MVFWRFALAGKRWASTRLERTSFVRTDGVYARAKPRLEALKGDKKRTNRVMRAACMYTVLARAEGFLSGSN
jgi:hypothetical protein